MAGVIQPMTGHTYIRTYTHSTAAQHKYIKMLIILTVFDLCLSSGKTEHTLNYSTEKSFFYLYGHNVIMLVYGHNMVITNHIQNI